jgi:hypothetical protein
VSLETWKTVAEIVQAAITSGAVVVGSVWAYFKFIKGRTFRPRVNPEIDAAWLGTEGGLGLHVLLRLENIGGTKVGLGKRGTGVQISHVAKEQDDAPADTQWELSRGFDAFATHEWIEPGETITDELLIRVPTKHEVMEVKMRILLKRWGRNITVQKRRIISLTEIVSTTGARPAQAQITTKLEEHDGKVHQSHRSTPS